LFDNQLSAVSNQLSARARAGINPTPIWDGLGSSGMNPGGGVGGDRRGPGISRQPAKHARAGPRYPPPNRRKPRVPATPQHRRNRRSPLFRLRRFMVWGDAAHPYVAIDKKPGGLSRPESLPFSP